MTQDRMIAPHKKPGEGTTDSALRPKNLNDYLGQKEIKEKLRVYVQACKLRQEPLDHMLLFGPPGLGKTTTVPSVG